MKIEGESTNGFSPLDISLPFREGEEVYVLGYPIFTPNENTSPTYSSGIISKIVLDKNNEPAIIQTTAPIHAGNSGGMMTNR